MAGFLIHHFPSNDFDAAWQIVAKARQKKKIVAGTHAAMFGKTDTALNTFTGIKNRRFAEAILFPCKPYSYPDDDYIARGFTLFLG